MSDTRDSEKNTGLRSWQSLYPTEEAATQDSSAPPQTAEERRGEMREYPAPQSDMQPSPSFDQAGMFPPDRAHPPASFDAPEIHPPGAPSMQTMEQAWDPSMGGTREQQAWSVPNPKTSRKKMRKRIFALGLFLCGNQVLLIIGVSIFATAFSWLASLYVGSIGEGIYLVEETMEFSYLNMIFAVALAYILIAIYNRQTGLTLKKQFAPSKVGVGYVVIAFCVLYTANLLGYFVYLPIDALLGAFNLAPPTMSDSGGTTALFHISYIAYGVVLAPVFEELVFRGTVLMTLRRYGDRFAIVASSLLFALMHGNLPQAVQTFFIALVLGYVCVKTNSLRIPILLHALNNATVILINEYLIFDSDVLNGLVELTFGLMVLAMVIFAVVYTIVRFRQLRLPKDRRLLAGSPYSAFFTSVPMLLFIVGYLVYMMF